MFGAIVGDIVGSVYEWHNIKTKEFPLFREDASKGGLSSFMKGAALELSAKGIRCNAILPGMVETGMMKGKESISQEQWELNKQQYPLKRFGSPEEIAWLAVYLFSDASAFMTGSELVIDGGRSLR